MKNLVLGIGGFKNLPTEKQETDKSTEVQFFVIFLVNIPMVVIVAPM